MYVKGGGFGGLLEDFFFGVPRGDLRPILAYNIFLTDITFSACGLMITKILELFLFAWYFQLRTD